jgi:hypothetical protein
LITQGAVEVMGDLQIGREDLFITIGMRSSIAVRGKASISAYPIVYFEDDDIAALKKDRYTYQYSTFLTSTDADSTLPNEYLLASHARRHCLRPYTSLSGDAKNWQLGMRYKSSCGAWWIILVSTLPIVIGGLLGFFIPMYVK